MFGSKMSLAVIGILTGAATIAGSSREAFASPQPFIYAATGPGQGEGVISLGSRGFIISEFTYVPLPTFELNYVRGLTSALDFELHVTTLGVLTLADVGGKLRLLGDERFSLALRADASAVLAAVVSAGASAAGGAGGVTPGVIVSFGSSRTQFSLGCDVPMFFGGAVIGKGGSAATSGFGYTIRPAATIEFAVGESTNMYIQGQVWIQPESRGSPYVLPTIAIGAAW